MFGASLLKVGCINAARWHGVKLKRVALPETVAAGLPLREPGLDSPPNSGDVTRCVPFVWPPLPFF